MACEHNIMTSDKNKDMCDSDNSLTDNIELYILNEHNKFISKSFINNILKKYDIGYKIKNLKQFQTSLTHTSYLKLELLNDKNMKRHHAYIKDNDVEQIKNPDDAMPLQDCSYERLEFLGDSIIRSVLSNYIYGRYSDKDEGFMTRLRTKIEKGESLAKLAKSIQLHEYIIISRLIEMKNGRNQNTSILEDVFEAFIGALSLEAGYDTCDRFIVKVIEKEVDFAELLHNEDNYKDMLLQFYHKKKWDDPKYTSLTTSGNDNKKEFTMYVKDNNSEIIGLGTGPSKKKGEQEAARRALIKLGVLNEDSDDSDSEIESDEYEYSDDDCYSISSGEYVGTDSDPE